VASKPERMVGWRKMDIENVERDDKEDRKRALEET